MDGPIKTKFHKNGTPSIIKQSVTSLKNKDYGIAIFPLFGAFDNIISRWARDELTLSYNHQNVYIGGFRNKLEKAIENREDINENINSIK